MRPPTRGATTASRACSAASCRSSAGRGGSYKRVKHGALLGVYGVLVAARHLGITPLVEKDVRAADRASTPVAPSRVKILFIARHFTYFRNYETVIAELAAARASAAPRRRARRGSRRPRDGGAAGARASRACRFGWVPGRDDRWARVRDQAADDDRLPAVSRSRRTPARPGCGRGPGARAAHRLVAGGAAAARTPRSAARSLRTVLQACERAIPRSAAIDAFLREQQPDVVLFTPLIGVVASPQLDCLQSARALGLSDGAVRLELGSPLEQGDSAHRSGPRVRLERHAAATKRSRCTACRRIASSSPARSASTSGSTAGRRWTATTSAGRSDCRPTGRSCCTCVRRFSRAAPSEALLRAALGPRAAGKRAGAARVDADPGAPASVAHEGVGRRRSLVRGRRRAVGAEPGRRRRPHATTSIRCSTAPRSSASIPARFSKARSPAGRSMPRCCRSITRTRKAPSTFTTC